MQGFTPRPVNQAGLMAKKLATAARSSEEGGAKCITTVHTELRVH